MPPDLRRILRWASLLFAVIAGLAVLVFIAGGTPWETPVFTGLTALGFYTASRDPNWGDDDGEDETG